MVGPQKTGGASHGNLWVAAVLLGLQREGLEIALVAFDLGSAGDLDNGLVAPARDALHERPHLYNKTAVPGRAGPSRARAGAGRDGTGGAGAGRARTSRAGPGGLLLSLYY